MGEPACRACRGGAGHLVLDLGEQPACDYFPRCDDVGPDPEYPLQMWLCSACGLAQLVADPTVPEEPRGAEPGGARRAGRRCRPAGRGGRPCPPGGWYPPSTAARMAAPGLACWRSAGSAGAGRPAGRCGHRLFRVDARRGPVGGPRRAGGQGGSRRRAAAAVPLAGYDHPLRPVERAPARSLCLLLDNRAGRDAGRGRFQPADSVAFRALRRHRAAGRGPGLQGVSQAWPCWTARCERCSRRMPGLVSVTPPCWAAWSAARTPGPTDCATGSSPSGPPGQPCSVTVPLSPAVALLRRAGVDRSLLPAVADASPASKACGCREQTSPWSARRGSPNARLPRWCCSCRTC